MNLREKIQADFKEAFKSKDSVRLSVLKMLQAAVKNAEIEKKTKGKEGELEEDEITQVISKEAKKRKEAMEIYEKEGRVEQAKQEKAEFEVLSAYLPEQISEDELRNLIKNAIEKSNASSPQDMGKVMAVLMPEIKGRADSSLVVKIVKEFLGQK